MTPPADTQRYKHHRFPFEIISHGVWLYYQFNLSYRDVQELSLERGIEVSHESIRPGWNIFRAATSTIDVRTPIGPRVSVSVVCSGSSHRATLSGSCPRMALSANTSDLGGICYRHLSTVKK